MPSRGPLPAAARSLRRRPSRSGGQGRDRRGPTVSRLCWRARGRLRARLASGPSAPG